MRSGEQAALGNDLKELMDALGIERAVLCGYDWGGRAACIVAALWPERVRGLVTGGGYNMHDVAGSAKPARRRAGASLLVPVLLPHRARPRRARRKTAATSPGCCGGCGRRTGTFDDATFEATARVVRQSGFCRGGDPLVPGALRLRAGRSGARGDRARLAAQPPITVPTITLHGRGRRHHAAGSLRGACAPLHRAVPPSVRGSAGGDRVAGRAGTGSCKSPARHELTRRTRE